MTLWPRSLFGRLTLLLIVVVALAALTTALLFNRDRAALIARQFGETKIVQLKALRAALVGADGSVVEISRPGETGVLWLEGG